MDPVQARLAVDLAMEGRRYSFKWGGDREPSGDQGCTLKEATVALACADPVSRLAVQAKREISLLWDTESEDYKRLFHQDLTAQRLWNAVQIMRAVDSTTELLRRGDYPQAYPVGVHLKHLVIHLVFQSKRLDQWELSQDPNGLATVAEEVGRSTFQRICQHIAVHHPGDYLAPLSKNFDKCETIARALLSIGEEPGLFNGLL